MPSVRDHSGAETLAPPSQQTEHQTIDADQQHAGAAFVAVRRAEDDSREYNPSQRGARYAGKLLLQVAAKDDLFTESCRRTQTEPNQQLKRGCGNQEPQLTAHGLELATRIEAKQVTSDAENRDRSQPEAGGDQDIAQHGFNAVPASANELSQTYAAAHAENDKTGQQPLPRHGPEILQELGAGGQRMRAARPGQ